MMQKRIERLTMDWFLLEPALLKVLMLHNVTENASMQCPVRCGNRRIEYNPALCNEMTDKEFAETMKTECIRILLKHPYERQPDNCSAIAITQGSNCVVADNYKMKFINLSSPDDFKLKKGQHFEYYAKEIQKQLSQQQQEYSDDAQSDDQQNASQSSSDEEKSGKDKSDKNESGGANSNQDNSENEKSVQKNSCNEKSEDRQSLGEQSALWKEEPMAAAEINEIIHVLESTRQWGSLSNDFIGKIIASSKAKIDYRRVLQLFRTEVLSSKRKLTRMRPNRRSGFQNFGSVYQLTSRLLVAVDISGSTTDEMVSEFFGVINKFFKYGIEDIDVIQFDAAIKGEPMSLKKAKKDGINIVGRGGTDFQPVFDYAAEQKNKYQGLVILTDGCASKPQLPDYFHTPVLWALPQEVGPSDNWLSEYGKVCIIKK